MTDELDQVIMDALIARPWILKPTLPRNDKQTFELGVRCGWDARAATRQARLEQLENTGRALLDALDGIHLDAPTADTQEVIDARAEFRGVLYGNATPHPGERHAS